MSDDKKDHLEDALGINSSKQDVTLNTIFEDAHNDSAITDFEKARSNIMNMIEDGNETLAVLAQLADQSQNPRAYEVYAKMMDSLLEANKQLLELQVKIRAIKQSDEPINGPKTVNNNNNLFITTAELQKMISGMKNNV